MNRAFNLDDLRDPGRHSPGRDLVELSISQVHLQQSDLVRRGARWQDRRFFGLCGLVVLVLLFQLGGGFFLCGRGVVCDWYIGLRSCHGGHEPVRFRTRVTEPVATPGAMEPPAQALEYLGTEAVAVARRPR